MTELGIAVGILWALFFSCATIAGALGIAWANFGHPRYALSWALAFGIGSLRTALNAVAIMTHSAALGFVAIALVTVPSIFFAIGVRQRAGLPDRRRRYTAMALAAAAFAIVAGRTEWLVPFGRPAVILLSALILMDAAAILRPRAPRPEVAEWGLSCAAALLAGVELIIAILACAYQATGNDPRIGAMYRVMLSIVAPPCTIAAGVSAILVIASDLAIQLHRIAMRDPLTGLYNRRGFQDLAMQTIARALRHHQPLSLVLCDIDHFKRINDDHGHAIGDHALVYVSRRLSAGLRADDLVGRIGGEEFALLVLDSRGYEAAQTTDRIRADVAAGLEAGEERIPVTVSFGIAEIGQEGTIDAMLTDAFDRADRALYRSKVDGRDRVTLAGHDPEPRLALERPAEAGTA